MKDVGGGPGKDASPNFSYSMGKLILTDNGKIRDMDHVEFAELISELRTKGDTWAVIDELVKFWGKNAKDDEAAMKINLQQYRETQKDKKFGKTLGGKEMERRFIMAMPKSLMLMIRTQYKADELPMDAEFYQKFATRYPFFKVAEQT